VREIAGDRFAEGVEAKDGRLGFSKSGSASDFGLERVPIHSAPLLQRLICARRRQMYIANPRYMPADYMFDTTDTLSTRCLCFPPAFSSHLLFAPKKPGTLDHICTTPPLAVALRSIGIWSRDPIDSHGGLRPKFVRAPANPM
jgi:hypothetical protein